MFSWLESEILAMPSADYLVLLVVLAGLLIYLAYLCYASFRRFRYIGGTATSRIRSAAQGHVELKGLAEWMPEDSIFSPFSNSRCVWFHCTVEKKQRSGKRTTWVNISTETSDHLFHLVDDTGTCIVDPDAAHIIPETDETWYGSSLKDKNRPPEGSSWLKLGVGRYRFREKLVRPATEIYVLGWFRSVHSNPSEAFITRETEALVRQWKLQPERYLTAFDFNGDRSIKDEEWDAIRAAARREVTASLNRESGHHHIISRPSDGKLPFILSATPEMALLRRKKQLAYGSLVLAFTVFWVLALFILVRPPLSV